MSAREARPRLKSTTYTAEQPHTAAPAALRTAVGGPKVVGRQAVPSGSDPHPTTVTGIPPGLHVRMSRPPAADWLCVCGHHERARGRSAVIALAHRAAVGTCPHRTTAAATAAGRRNAA